MDTIGLIAIAVIASILVSLISIKRELLLGYLVSTILFLIIIYFGEKGDSWTQIYKIIAGAGGVVMILGGGLIHSLFLFDIENGKTKKDVVVEVIIFCLTFFVCATRFYREFMEILYYLLIFVVVLGFIVFILISRNNKANSSSKAIGQKKQAKDTLINTMLAGMEVSDVSEVWFVPIGMGKFIARTENIKRMGVLLVRGKGKNSFAPNELQDACNYILEHYDSHLSDDQFELLKNELLSFAKNGGDIIIKQKTTNDHSH